MSDILRDIEEAADTIFRDFGVVAGYHHRHSKRCVYVQDERGVTRWCCADDCRMIRPSSP